MAERSRGKANKHGKSDVRYWEGKLFHDGYTRNGKRVVSPDWSVRVQHAQRREAFALNTPNKSNAANQAREIFLCLKGAGWDETLKRFKPATTKTEITEVTAADFLREAQAIAGLKAKSFADYAKALRLIVASVFTIDGGRRKSDALTGGREKWLEVVGAVKIADLTPERIQKWKLSFVQRAGADPPKRRTARISVNSLMRQAKALFSKSSSASSICPCHNPSHSMALSLNRASPCGSTARPTSRR